MSVAINLSILLPHWIRTRPQRFFRHVSHFNRGSRHPVYSSYRLIQKTVRPKRERESEGARRFDRLVDMFYSFRIFVKCFYPVDIILFANNLICCSNCCFCSINKFILVCRNSVQSIFKCSFFSRSFPEAKKRKLGGWGGGGTTLCFPYEESGTASLCVWGFAKRVSLLPFDDFFIISYTLCPCEIAMAMVFLHLSFVNKLLNYQNA